MTREGGRAPVEGKGLACILTLVLCEVLVLTGSLNETPCTHHKEKPPSPSLFGISDPILVFQQLIASPGKL